MSTSLQAALPIYDRRKGNGPTLVFLHYWGGSARTWHLVVDALTDHDVLTVDFRGWGRSKELAGPYTLQQFADDVLATIADARIEDFILIGHSMGGKVAQKVAARRPAGLRALVLVASAPAKPGADITPEYQQALSHAYDSDESVAHVRDNILTAASLPQATQAQVVADSRSGTDAARSEWPLRGIAEDVTQEARRIDAPVLVVAAEDDRVEPAEVLRTKLVPYLLDARMVVVPASGHLLPLEAPDALAAIIMTFIAALERPE